jgi:GWxTD domain-containing protein
VRRVRGLWWLLLAAAPVVALVGPAAPVEARSRAARAEQLYQRALAHLAERTLDARRTAIDELERATLLAPGQPAYQLTLARTYYQAGFLRNARERFELISRLAPEDAESRYGLGQVWRRDWLKYLDTTSLDKAVLHLREAARMRPDYCDAWLMMVPLLVEQRNLNAAAAAAFRAREADPLRPEALIADAYTAYRLGRVAHADSAFDVALPRLKRSVRERFDDIAPVASERDTFVLHRLPANEQESFVRRFWKELDPDFATPENEAQLEYWSRVSHAYFLYYDPKRREWDERGEVYVRYGPPATTDYNPVGEKLYVLSPFGQVFQSNLLVWDYPELGMRVAMQDRLLSEYYQLPVAVQASNDPVPDPDSLERRSDVLGAGGGRGVFPRLPPGTRRRPVDGAVARFEGPGGPRLLAQLEADGPPDDSLWAEWVVLDSSRAEVARARRTLVPSACEPAEKQVADFASQLAPGRYLVGLTVLDRAGRRGLFRSEVELPPPKAQLSLSDVVVSCGLPFQDPNEGAPAVRLEPNPSARVSAREPLTAYFEIYHLQPDREGRARFEYVYTVRSAEKDRRIWIQRAFQPRPQVPQISASREAEQVGSMRRQFVRVPVQSLPAGKYRLEVTVRDRIADVEARGAAEFVRLAEPAPRGSGASGAGGPGSGAR